MGREAFMLNRPVNPTAMTGQVNETGKSEWFISDQSPVAWRYRVLVNKHATGTLLPGEVSMLDVSRQLVWGTPGQWRYSDGPNKPDVDWMCEAEPLYAAPVGRGVFIDAKTVLDIRRAMAMLKVVPAYTENAVTRLRKLFKIPE